MSHLDPVYDELRKRYYDNDKAKQAALRNEVAEDENLQRGVTIEHKREGKRVRWAWERES